MVTPVGGWPAISFRSADWVVRNDDVLSRRARQRVSGPYRAAVVPSIASVVPVLPPDLMAAAEDAAAEIARFDADMGGEIPPFAAVLLRSESAASSKIENLTASARAIAQAELGLGRGNANLIVANERTMSAAVALAGDISTATILRMHDVLLHDSQPAIAGKWRSEQVWVGGGHFGPHDAHFVPPLHTDVPLAMDDLVRFARRTDMPVVVHAALAHAQFLTIHPFPDGNGRTARALVHAQLRHARLTRHVTVPVSAGLLSSTAEYFAALDVFRLGDAVPIVERFIDASFGAIGNGRRLVRDLRETRDAWNSSVKARRGATAWKIADLVVRQPVITARYTAERLGIPPSNVYRALQPLIEAGVLVESSDARRNQIWRAPEVLLALDAFAARAGRRQRPMA